MKWPRGKYNGQRISGFEVRMALDVLSWRLNLWYGHGLMTIFVGPVHIWIRACYKHPDPF